MANKYPFALGRLEPPNKTHEAKHPLVLTGPEPAYVNTILPYTKSLYGVNDQGQLPACTGFAGSIMQEINHRPETGNWTTFDPIWLWLEAQKIDGLGPVSRDRGSTIVAVCTVMEKEGMLQQLNGTDLLSPDLKWGIASYKWAKTSAQLRQVLATGPIAIDVGTNWYENMFYPTMASGPGGVQWPWVGPRPGQTFKKKSLGQLAGGHSWVIHGAVDYDAKGNYNAFVCDTSWGDEFPTFLVSYTLMDYLLAHNGEAAVVVESTNATSMPYADPVNP